MTDYEMDTVMAEWVRTSNSCITLCRMIEAAVLRKLSARAADAPSEPPRLDTEESREYLVTFMEQHFTDTTFHRYIRGQIGGSGPLAGDFAWQMARALRRIEAGVVESRAADALDSQPTERASNDAVKIAVSALKEISEWRFGWDGDCGVTAVADAALEAIEAAHASSRPTDGGVRNG